MPNLYITEPGARLEIDAGRIVVASGDDVLVSLPPGRVDTVVMVGRIGLTTPALGLLLDAGIGLLLLDSQGRYRGRLVAERSRNVELRQRQYRRADDPAFCLAAGRGIVSGKIRNCRTLLMRHDADGDPTTSRMAAELGELLPRIPAASTLYELLGVEGQAARCYFAGLRAQIDPEWAFARRARRPPPDPVNALLSISYTLLHESCYSAIEAAGLDPTVGFYHLPAYGRASLAADLMEEFRPVIADSVVLTLLNKRIVAPGDFAPSADGRSVRVKREVWRKIAEQFTRRMRTTVRPPGLTRSISYQKVLEVQARALRRMIEGETDAYEPFRTR
jgi:CRISPR-associated protein Cas1